jgi:hypothetical protein
MAQRLLANRKFITLQQGFRKKGQYLDEDHPEFKKFLKGAEKTRDDNHPNPVWIIEEVTQEVDTPAIKEVTQEVDTPAIKEVEEVEKPVKRGAPKKNKKA